MRVVCPYTPARLRRGTVEALVAQAPHAEFVDVSGAGDAYFDLFRGLWEGGVPFMVVEHDVVIQPGTVAALEACAEPYCSVPMLGHPHENGKSTEAWFQCNRWRPAEFPPVDLDLPMIERHWGQMDSFVLNRINRTGIRPHAHVDLRTMHLAPSVGHSQDHAGRRDWQDLHGPRVVAQQQRRDPRVPPVRRLGVDCDKLFPPVVSPEEGDGMGLLEELGHA